MGKVATDDLIDPFFDRLEYLDGANLLKVCFCSAEPTTYTQAITTYMLAYREIVYPAAGVSLPLDGTTGRRVTIGPLVSILVEATGTITHIAIVDKDDEVILYTASVTSLSVTEDERISMDTIIIEVGDPV